jgi:hypothetical protein
MNRVISWTEEVDSRTILHVVELTGERAKEFGAEVSQRMMFSGALDYESVNRIKADVIGKYLHEPPK